MRNRLVKYYIPFVPANDINYLYLFRLYQHATFNNETKCYDTIAYNTINNLAEMLDISSSTAKRIIKDTRYNDYFMVDTDNKTIILYNDIRTNGLPFVCLDKYEVYYLCNKGDNLLCKYLLYIKYYCGYSKNGETDFTAGQFLTACGYSANSGYPSKLSEYNSLLVDYGYISIKRKRDNKGHLRNIYTYTH